MATGTSEDQTVTVERSARLLRESLTRCRRDVSSPLRDEHIRNLQKRLDNDRIKPCDHICEILYDAFRRGAPRESVEAFFRAGTSMVGSWYEDHGDYPDLPTLIRCETEAQCVADLGEINMALDPTTKNVADAAELLRGHLVALDRLVTGCERLRFAAVAGRKVA